MWEAGFSRLMFREGESLFCFFFIHFPEPSP